MQQPDLDPLRRVQLDPVQVGVVGDPLDQIDEVALAQQQVVLVEAELADAACEPVLHLLVGAAELADPDPPPLVEHVRGAVAAFERAAAARREDRVFGQPAARLRLARAVFPVQVQVQGQRVGVRDRRGDDDVPTLLIRVERVQFAALQVQRIAQAKVGDRVFGGEGRVDAADSDDGLGEDLPADRDDVAGALPPVGHDGRNPDLVRLGEQRPCRTAIPWRPATCAWIAFSRFRSSSGGRPKQYSIFSSSAGRKPDHRGGTYSSVEQSLRTFRIFLATVRFSLFASRQSMSLST